MEFSTEAQDQLVNCLRNVVQGWIGEEEGLTSRALEAKIRRLVQAVGGDLLRFGLEALGSRHCPKEVPCVCGGRAAYRFHRTATVIGVFGRISYRGACYICPECHRGVYPLDQELGIRPGEVSVELGSLLALLGVQTAFGEASHLAEEAAWEWLEQVRDRLWQGKIGRVIKACAHWLDHPGPGPRRGRRSPITSITASAWPMPVSALPG